MQNVADIARALTDAAVVHLSAILLLLAGSAVALGGLVASGIAWLCYVELRSRLTYPVVTRPRRDLADPQRDRDFART